MMLPPFRGPCLALSVAAPHYGAWRRPRPPRARSLSPTKTTAAEAAAADTPRHPPGATNAVRRAPAPGAVVMLAGLGAGTAEFSLCWGPHGAGALRAQLAQLPAKQLQLLCAAASSLLRKDFLADLPLPVA